MGTSVASVAAARKVYLKGAEFLKNDAKRFRKAGHEGLAYKLTIRAHGLMRLVARQP